MTEVNRHPGRGPRGRLSKNSTYLGIRVDGELKEALEEISVKEGVTISELMRRALVKAYVKK